MIPADSIRLEDILYTEDGERMGTVQTILHSGRNYIDVHFTNAGSPVTGRTFWIASRDNSIPSDNVWVRIS